MGARVEFTTIDWVASGAVAQPEERRRGTPEAGGSSPPSSTPVAPVGYHATVSRGLMEGSAAASDMVIVLATAAALTAAFAPLTTRLYRTRG